MGKRKSSSPIGNNFLDINKRRALVSELYFDKGLTLAQVQNGIVAAGFKKVSITQIKKDKDWALEQWRIRATDSISVHKQRELDRLSMIEEEALACWRKSIGKHLTVTSKTTSVMSMDKEGELTQLPGIEETRKIEELDGDPRYMEIMLDCAKQRRELLGLDAPKTFAGVNGGPMRFIIEGLAGAGWLPKDQTAG